LDLQSLIDFCKYIQLTCSGQCWTFMSKAVDRSTSWSTTYALINEQGLHKLAEPRGPTKNGRDRKGILRFTRLLK